MRLSTKAFVLGLTAVCGVARQPRLSWLSDLLARLGAAATLRVKRGRPQTGVRELGLEYQRMFPSKKALPIVGMDDRTVRLEIRAPCPLRGGGDLQACNRVMQYDAHLLKTLGGRLVVLRSQAEPGVEVCELALRRAGDPVDDLTPAHARAPAPPPEPGGTG